MTIGHGTHITTGKRHHATVQRQVLPPLAPAAAPTISNARATPRRQRIAPKTVVKANARSDRPHPVTAPRPHENPGPNLLPP